MAPIQEFLMELNASIQGDIDAFHASKDAGTDPPPAKVQGVAIVVALGDGQMQFQMTGNPAPLQLGLLLLHNKVLADFARAGTQPRRLVEPVTLVPQIPGQGAQAAGPGTIILP